MHSCDHRWWSSLEQCVAGMCTIATLYSSLTRCECEVQEFIDFKFKWGCSPLAPSEWSVTFKNRITPPPPPPFLPPMGFPIWVGEALRRILGKVRALAQGWMLKKYARLTSCLQGSKCGSCLKKTLGLDGLHRNTRWARRHCNYGLQGGGIRASCEGNR